MPLPWEEDELPEPVQRWGQAPELALPPPPGMVDEEAIARTMYGEGRGSTAEDRAAIANVIVNRLRSGRHGPNVEAVVREPSQFSAWNPDDPNLPQMEALEGPSFKNMIAEAIKAVGSKDPTGGATFYHVKSLEAPPWTAEMEPTADIGAHRFYKKKKRKRLTIGD